MTQCIVDNAIGCAVIEDPWNTLVSVILFIFYTFISSVSEIILFEISVPQQRAVNRPPNKWDRLTYFAFRVWDATRNYALYVGDPNYAVNCIKRRFYESA